jgi:DNA invertase Pin-like site-specific DNA recombinase
LHNYSKDCVVGINPGELLNRARADQRKNEPGRRSQKTARQLHTAEIDRLVARYIEVRNIRKVALELKLSRTTVAKPLSDRGVLTSKSMNDEQVAKAVALYADGLSSIVIGKQLGFDNHTIIKALRGQDVAIRPALGN